MTTSAVSAAASTTSSSAFGLTTAADKSMGKDDFLKLLMAQIQNQDPLNPQDNSAYVAQLAQFSNLEQTQKVNSNLDLLLLQARGQSNTEVLGMIGDKVTANGSTITSDGSGTATQVGYTLNASAASTKITITNKTGEVVRTIDAGAQKAGYETVTWDGKNSSGTLQPSGSYLVSVSATDRSGNAVTATQNMTGTVMAVSYDQGYAVLHLDNGAEVLVSNLIKVESAPVVSAK